MLVPHWGYQFDILHHFVLLSCTQVIKVQQLALESQRQMSIHSTCVDIFFHLLLFCFFSVILIFYLYNTLVSRCFFSFLLFLFFKCASK